MSIEDILNRNQKSPDVSDPDVVEDQGAFGFIRAPRERALMVELRKKEGAILAIPYSHIEQIKFTEADGITILANGYEIRIKGRHLNTPATTHISLLNGLCRRRIAWVQENSRAALASASNQPAIESLHF